MVGNSHDYHFQNSAYEHSTTRGFGFSVRCILLSYLFTACDYDYDNQEIFDLTDIEAKIKIDYPTYKVTFYTNFFNAQSGGGLGLLSNNHSVEVSDNPEIIFARLEDASGKFIDGIKIKLKVNKAPEVDNFNTIFYCTTIVGNTNGLFNIKSIENHVENSSDFTFKYYTKEASAIAGATTDVISNPASYYGSIGLVYVRIENDNGCFIVKEIPLAISAMDLVPQTANINPFCATEKIDLTSFVSEFTSNPNRYQFYFYTSEISANTNSITTAIQDPKNFELTGLNNFSIWVNISLNGGANCAKIISKLNFSVNAIPEIKIKTILPICEGNSINLEVETESGNFVNWYDSETSATPIFTGNSFVTPNLQSDTIYWAESVNSFGCISPRISVEVKVNVLPVFNIPSGILICENTSTLLEVTTSSINTVNWFDSPTSIMPIFTGNQFQTSLISSNTSFWIEVTNLESCVSDRTEILVETKAEMKPQFNIQTQFCENSASVIFLLISENGISGTWNFPNIDTSTIGKKIYVFTPNPNQCASQFSIEIEIRDKLKPQFSFATQYCHNSNSESLPTTSDNGIIGVWNVSNVNTSEIGIKTYIFTPNDDCSEIISIDIEIVSVPEISKVEINGKDIVVIATGNALEYSLDGVNWQNSNIFINVNVGSYQVFVRNSSGCISNSSFVSILHFNNFISPNNDGNNDYWEIKGLPNNSNSRIQILDKNGKTLLDKNIDNQFKWDGKENGRPLQTDNYWYVLTLESGQVLSGYILLKNY